MTENNTEPQSRIDLVIKYTPVEAHILAQISEPVTDFGDELKQLVDKLAASLYFYEAMGISAIQIGTPQQVFLVRTTADSYAVFVNPEIVNVSTGTDIQNEGCLSFPGIFVPVERPVNISVKYQTIDGSWEAVQLTGIQARCFLHERDHLMGKTFLDRVSLLKKTLVLAKMKKAVKTGKIKRDEMAVQYLEAMAAASKKDEKKDGKSTDV